MPKLMPAEIEDIKERTSSPNPSDAKPGARSGDSQPEPDVPHWVWLVFTLVMIGVIGLWNAVPAFQAFIKEKWWVVLGAILLLGAASTLFGSVREWIKHSSVATRVALMVVGLALLSLVVIGGVTVLPAHHQITALRGVFLAVVCIFPPTLYYLFISTRKYSLLFEFIMSLDRLGLLQKRRTAPHCATPNSEMEDDVSRQLRIRAYLQRFQAAYGSLPTVLLDKTVNAEDVREVYSCDVKETQSAGFTSIFHQGSTPPLIISTVLIALGWVLVLPPVLPSDHVAKEILAGNWTHSFVPECLPVYFAFLGAYFFAIQMLFRRYLHKDMRGSAYTAVSLRILMAVIGTWVAVQVSTFLWPLNNSQLSVVAFAIGFFPPVAWQIVRMVVKRVTFAGIALPDLQKQLPLSDLDGLHVWHQTRLEEEDIESMADMANADLIDLVLNTRIPVNRLVDWVDQAILYTHLPIDNPKEYRSRLRAHGIRTASELLYAYERLKCQDDLAKFEAILHDSANPNARSPIRGIAMTLFTNPNLCLIQSWRGLTVHAEEVAAKTEQAAAAAAG